MEKLKEVLAGHGVARAALDAMDDAAIKNLARAFNLNVRDFLPRNVKIETGKNGAQYVVTETYTVPKYANKVLVPGETSPSRNLYVRVEAIDQIIADLTAAKGLLSK